MRNFYRGEGTLIGVSYRSPTSSVEEDEILFQMIGNASDKKLMLTLGLLGGGGWVPPPLAFFPYYFFDDSNWKNCFSVSVTRDRRHILAYVTSS